MKHIFNYLRIKKQKDNKYDNPYTKENESSSSDNVNDFDEKPRDEHGKQVNVSSYLHSN